MIYNSWDTVLVPFPFTDRKVNKKRPALVINKPDYQINTGHLVLLMITSAKNSNWNNDIIIDDINKAGLPTASVVRLKIFSIDERFIIKQLGILFEKDRQNIIQQLNNILI